MAESIYMAVHFEGSPLKKLVSTYVSDEFGGPLSGWTIMEHPNLNAVTGYELSDMLEDATSRFEFIHAPWDSAPYDLLNGRLMRGVTELLTCLGYRLANPDNDVEFRHVDHTAGFTPVQSVGGDIGRLIVVAPLV